MHTSQKFFSRNEIIYVRRKLTSSFFHDRDNILAGRSVVLFNQFFVFSDVCSAHKDKKISHIVMTIMT